MYEVQMGLERMEEMRNAYMLVGKYERKVPLERRKRTW